MWSGETTNRIDKLRLTGADTPALRLAASAQLTHAELKPPGLSPSAVLIVRHLADPLPGRLTPRQSRVGVGHRWERAVQARLAELQAHAARPNLGPVSATANTVLFTDQAEMLACLVMDMSQGAAREHWWWQTLLRGLPDVAAEGITWLLSRQSTQVPAVLHHLTQRHQAVKVLGMLTPAQAMTILTAVSQVYDLPAIEGETSGPPPSHGTAGPLSGSAIWSEAASNPIAPEPPWQDWFANNVSTAGLRREQSCLLGVGLGLYHAPAVVRSSDFRSKLHNWWLAEATMPKRFTSSAGQVSGQSPSKYAYPVQQQSAIQPQCSVAPAGDAISSEIPTEEESFTLDRSVTTQAHFTTQQGPSSPQPFTDTQGVDRQEQATIHQAPSYRRMTSTPPAAVEDRQSSSTIPSQTIAPPTIGNRPWIPERMSSVPPETNEIQFDQEPIDYTPQSILDSPAVGIRTALPEMATDRQEGIAETSWRLEDGVVTQLSGAWYLIILMVSLDLPDCYEKDWQLATHLGPWGTLEALARAMLSDDDAMTLSKDPLWLALANLAGRQAGTPLGNGLPEGMDFHLPEAWFAYPGDIDPVTCCWANEEQRLRLWSLQGYLLAEIVGGSGQELAQAEMHRYLGDHPCRLQRQSFTDAHEVHLDSALTANLSPQLKRWLILVIPYLRWRLKQASIPTDGDSWLLQQGRLYITTTHVDLVMSLDDVSVPIRLAGLDRDPGWLPQFGRVIKFHFE